MARHRHRRRSSGSGPALWLALVAVIAIGIGVRLLIWGNPMDHGPREVAGDSDKVAIGGPFLLTDGEGKQVTDGDFKGKIMLIYFGYTFCPDVCPTELGLVAKALDQLPTEQRDKVAPLFITVDPERDTPEVIKAYVATFHPQLVGLTGTPEQIAAVEKSYHVYAAKVPGGDDKTYTMDHSSVLYLMGPDGQYMKHWGRNATVDQIVQGLRQALP